MTKIEVVVEAIKDATEDYAKRLPPDGDWEPMLFMFKGGNITTSVFPMPPNGAMRDFLFETVLPNQIRPHEPDAVVILVSAWMAGAVEKKELDKIMAGESPLPSERPDRKEVVMIQGVSKEGEAGVFGQIIRSDGPPELEWADFPDAVGFEGRLMAALRRGVWG